MTDTEATAIKAIFPAVNPPAEAAADALALAAPLLPAFVALEKAEAFAP